MNGRMHAGRFLALLGASCTMTAGLSACGPRAEDINRVQPGYVRKAIFQTEHDWYYRRTIAKSETTNAIAVEGHGDIFLDRIRWEIQEDLLIAYKPYEAIPGAQTQEWEGNTFFKGTVLGMWPISSHFDIQRSYDPATANETNVIDENQSDRPWSERDFMRIDWSSNLVDGGFAAQYAFGWIPVSWVSTGSRWSDIQTSPTDPYASRFSDDYVEVSESVLIGMDIYTCAAFGGYSWAHLDKCGFGEAKVRHAFWRVNEPSDYIPRDYPDSIVRKGADGKPIYDADTGEVLREPIQSRFGFFRIETPTYDRGYGTTESGRLFRAMIHNIWARHTDDNGNVIPMADRTPKPIIYYTNAEYPERYNQVASEVGAEYDRVFSSMVADAKGVSLDQLSSMLVASGGSGKMFEIRQNDCNAANIVQFVQNWNKDMSDDLLFAVERAVCVDGEPCMQPLDKIGIGNLEKVCTSLEAATLDPKTGKSAFAWQRIGDPRYKMVVWFSNPQQSGWGGYGPMHADARTGETVSATAFMRGFAYENRAAEVVDFIEFMNDEKSIEEIIYAQDVRKQMTETLRRRGVNAGKRANQQFVERFDRRMDKLGSTKAELLREVPNRNYKMERLARIAGTKLEEPLITDLDLIMASEGMWVPGEGAVSEKLRERASIAGRMSEGSPVSNVRQNAKNMMAKAGYCFFDRDFDPVYAGLAIDLRDMPREQRYQIVANRMVKHVMLHELGHNMGFLHNFEGSYDALNYHDEFWKWHWGTEEEKKDNSYLGYKNTTVMEYMSSKGLFSDYLGKYDEAAIRFAYANQIQVFNAGAVDPALEGGLALKDWRYLNDYGRLPDHLCGGTGCSDNDVRRDVVKSRSWVSFDPQNPPQAEVPYLFCDNTFDRQTPFCATFDYGASTYEIFENYKSWWEDYFFFNNFDRNRLFPLGWSIWDGIVAAIYTMDYIDNVGQYLYYLRATQPGFTQTDLASDMLSTVAQGLNFVTEVVATPEPIRMCPWPGVTNPKVYIPWYFQPESCDQYVDINSQYAQDAEAIQPPLGDARPSTLGFDSAYEDWYFTWVGSYFDKTNVLIYLGLNRPRFFRFNYDLDVRNYDLSLFRLFEPEIRSFYEKLIAFDYFYIRNTTATEIGSWWCRDPNDPTKASLGHFVPRTMLDPETGNPVAGPPAGCEDPAAIYPTVLANVPFLSMFVAHALFSSDFDSELDMGKSLKVYVVGADDDFVTWDALSPCSTAPAGQACYCSLTDSLTGLEYRSIMQPAGIPGVQDIPSLGCRLVDYATQAQDNYIQGNGSPWEKDNWRQWIERLEYARDLYREYHLR